MPPLMFRVLYRVAEVFKVGKSVPVLGRVLDVASASAVTMLRTMSGAFVASGLEKCARPRKVLKLYEFEGCPYCRKVREAICVLDLDVLIYPCPRETLKAYGVCEKSRFRPEVTKHGGQQKFPYLVDENTGVKMHESTEIIAYLFKTYGEGAVLPYSYKLGQILDKTPAFMLPALFRPLTTHGTLRVPSKKPEQPLELWGYEPSPFVKLVREALCVLELPYLWRTCAHGAEGKRQEYREKYGSMLSSLRRSANQVVQVPLLVDPNTGKTLLESADIVEYLFTTYQDGPLSEETWLDFNSAQASPVQDKKSD